MFPFFQVCPILGFGAFSSNTIISYKTCIHLNRRGQTWSRSLKISFFYPLTIKMFFLCERYFTRSSFEKNMNQQALNFQLGFESILSCVATNCTGYQVTKKHHKQRRIVTIPTCVSNWLPSRHSKTLFIYLFIYLSIFFFYPSEPREVVHRMHIKHIMTCLSHLDRR